MSFVNLTPHAVNIIDGPTFEPCGTVVRVTTTTENVGNIEGIPLTKTVFGEVAGLPEQRDGVFLIVSKLVAEALPERSDLLFPNQMVRDGQVIVGCRSLTHI